MKKRIISVIAAVAVLLSLSVAMNVSAAVDAPENWTLYCSQYDGSNFLLEDDEGFEATIDTNGAIKVEAPAGWWPCILGVKNDKVAVSGLTLDFHSYIADMGWGGNGFNVSLLNNQLNCLPGTLVSDGLYHAIVDGKIDDGIKGVEVVARGENDAGSTKLGKIIVIVYGTGAKNKNGETLTGADDAVYYEYVVDLPSASDYNVTFTDDADHGLLITVNDVALREDVDGEIPDLTVVKELTEAYLGIGAFAPGTAAGGLDIMKVNGEAVEAPAAPASSEAAPSSAVSLVTSKPAESTGCGNKA